uniref:Ovule protein n=1 Tax=Caenorhabditis tropicalis TaxID=1561998 RepID=A0A1I7UYF8_9PELO
MKKLATFESCYESKIIYQKCFQIMRYKQESVTPPQNTEKTERNAANPAVVDELSMNTLLVHSFFILVQSSTLYVGFLDFG